MRFIAGMSGFALLVVLMVIGAIEATSTFTDTTWPATLTDFGTYGPLLVAVTVMGLAALGLIGLLRGGEGR